MAYLNDILIFLKKNLKQHKKYVCKILDKLKEIRFYLDISKYKFEAINIKHLDFIIKIEKDIYIDSKKIKIIKK